MVPRLFDVSGFISAGWEFVTTDPAEVQNLSAKDEKQFFVRNARIRLTGHPSPRVRLRISADLKDAFDPEISPRLNYLRSAHINVRVHDLFQLRVGRFKRPFSRLELRSLSSLPVKDRGLGNRRLVRRAHWGARSQGLVVWGRPQSKRFRYALSVSNPGLDEQGFDVHARVSGKPVKGVDVGASGVLKRIADPTDATGQMVNLSAFGIDAQLKLKQLRIHAEVLAGEDARGRNPVTNERLQAGNATFSASYRFKLNRSVALEPIAFVEWVDSDLKTSESEALRTVLGANLRYSDVLRVLPQLELTRPLGNGTDLEPTPWLKRTAYYLMVSADI